MPASQQMPWRRACLAKSCEKDNAARIRLVDTAHCRLYVRAVNGRNLRPKCRIKISGTKSTCITCRIWARSLQQQDSKQGPNTTELSVAHDSHGDPPQLPRFPVCSRRWVGSRWSVGSPGTDQLQRDDHAAGRRARTAARNTPSHITAPKQLQRLQHRKRLQRGLAPGRADPWLQRATVAEEAERGHRCKTAPARMISRRGPVTQQTRRACSQR